MLNFIKKVTGPVQAVPTTADLVIRHARPDDAEELVKLAQLDSSRTPTGDVLVAEVAGELWAAISIDDGHSVATPFRPSGELTFRLAEYARRLRAPQGIQGGRPRRARLRTA
jgi:hypothetical protein